MHDSSHDDSNLMQVDQVHVEDRPNLVRYFDEKLVRDEDSACNSAHDLSDPKLMQTDEFNIGETLQDCIDVDELTDDFHSTAAISGLKRDSGSFTNRSDQPVLTNHFRGHLSLDN